MRLQLALVHQCAATAHFRMRIGNVLLRGGFCKETHKMIGSGRSALTTARALVSAAPASQRGQFG